MMNVYLIRHGQAKSNEEDSKRPLSDVGRETIKNVSSSMAKLGLSVSEIWHSDKLRAKETASILANALESTPPLKEHDGLAPNDDVRPIADQLMKTNKDIAIVGHLPFLNDLASLLLCGSENANIINFKTGTSVCLNRDVFHNWSLDWGITPDMAR